MWSRTGRRTSDASYQLRVSPAPCWVKGNFGKLRRPGQRSVVQEMQGNFFGTEWFKETENRGKAGWCEAKALEWNQMSTSEEPTRGLGHVVHTTSHDFNVKFFGTLVLRAPRLDTRPDIT